MTSESWSIHEAARKNNLAALRRYLDAGVSPDLVADDGYCLLEDTIAFGSAAHGPESIHQRLACIEALLEAGASVDLQTGLGEGTPLHCAVTRTDRSRFPADFELIVDRLLQAGADVNLVDRHGTSVLAAAAFEGRSTTVAKLLSAGAVDPRGFDVPLQCALERPEPRICALLMKAGGALKLDPDPERNGWLKRSPYLKKVYETPGGFPAYEKAHRQRLTEIFLPKLPSLPAEIVSHIVSFGFHCGCYEFDAVEPVAHRTRSKGG